MKKLSVIHEGANTKIWLLEKDGKQYAYKEVYHQPRLTTDFVYRSYQNHSRLRRKDGLVKVYDFWKEEETVCVLMEYLDGWVPVHSSELPRLEGKIRKIVKNLFSEGIMDVDICLINFLCKDDEVKLVDIDRLVNLYAYPRNPVEPIWDLTLLGSKVLDFFSLLI